MDWRLVYSTGGTMCDPPARNAHARRAWFLCLLLSFALPLIVRLLEYPLWDDTRMAAGEYLLTELEGYRWLAAVDAMESSPDAAQPMVVLLRTVGALPGLTPALAAFWLPLVFGCLLSVAVFCWSALLGYPVAGVLAGTLASLSPDILTRTMLGDYSGAILVPLGALFAGLIPLLWLSPWLRPPLLVLAEVSARTHAALAVFRGDEGGDDKGRSGFRAAVRAWYCRDADISENDALLTRTHGLSFAPLALLALAGLALWQLPKLDIFFLTAVPFVALCAPLLALIFAPALFRSALLGGALCLALPALTGWPGFGLALALALMLHFYFRFCRETPDGGGQERVHTARRALFCNPTLPGAAWGALLCWWFLYGGFDSTLLSPLPSPDSLLPLVCEMFQKMFREMPEAGILHPWPLLTPFGLAGFCLLLLIYPGLFLMAGLTLLGVSAGGMPGGNAGALLLPPLLALGLSLALARLAEDAFALFRHTLAAPMFGPEAAKALRAARRTRTLRAVHTGCAALPLRLALLLVCAFFLARPVYERLENWLPPPAVSQNLANAFASIRDADAGKDAGLVWGWWPWGYAARHFSGLPAVNDEGMKDGLAAYIPAAVYAAQDIAQAHSLLAAGKSSATGPESALAARLRQAGLRQEDIQALPKADSAFLSMLAGKETYLVVSLDMMLRAPEITAEGHRDFTRGNGRGEGLSGPFLSLSGNTETGVYRINEGIMLYAASFDRFSREGFTRQEYSRLAEGLHLLADARQKQEPIYIMGAPLYTMLLYRLLTCDPADPAISPYFELLYDNGASRVFLAK